MPPAVDRRADVVSVALVVPGSGPSGIYGPSCLASARLAMSEINEAGGILGRRLDLVSVDGGAAPHAVAGEVDRLVTSGRVDAVAGWHPSSVREQVAPRLGGRVPYIYTAVYEGGESRPGVFLTGETPSRQVLPALSWMAQELGIRRWFTVGNDYVWPRASAFVAREYARSVGASIDGEVFVRLGIRNFSGVLRAIERSGAQGVLMFLLGSDAVHFNRAFTRSELDSGCVRLSSLMDENMLMATGAANTGNLYSAAGYFETLVTPHSMDYEQRYVSHFGPTAPVPTSPGESCFEGLSLLAQLASAAGKIDVARMSEIAETVTYEGPRGVVRVQDRHLVQSIYLARADGIEFDVLAELTGVR